MTRDPVAASGGTHVTPDGMESWRIFRGDGIRRTVTMPSPPPWRRFHATSGTSDEHTDEDHEPPRYLIGPMEADVISAALHLRRPLLVTGSPGTGKSSLARAIAYELDLGSVLHWPVNSRSILQEALYRYDAIGRLQEDQRERNRGGGESSIGDFLRLGPVGTSLAPASRPRVLLVDEFDKGDMDLPNDLLTVFEEGAFEIPELSRLPDDQAEVDVLTADTDRRTRVVRGRVRCTEFPIVVITSNGEREFPPAFRRRCVPLHLADPSEARLREIIAAHLGEQALGQADELIGRFLEHRAVGELATDQLLNAVFLRAGGVSLDAEGLLQAVMHRLGGVV